MFNRRFSIIGLLSVPASSPKAFAGAPRVGCFIDAKPRLVSGAT
jgi:hypothetical protein